MDAFRVLGRELSKLKENKGVLFSVIGVLLIPLVYAAILLSATWGPYDHLDNLPVAFVNNDAGAISDGNEINAGSDLVEELKKSKSLGWNFVTQEEAEKGMKDQKYYMMIEVPEDFSKKVTTVLEDNPQLPELRYIQNEGLNFMAAQVTNSAVEKIREQLGNKITETYTRTLFAKLGDISNGFASGADGSSKIEKGTKSLSKGTQQLLDSLNEKSTDIDKLAVGSSQAATGSQQLLSSIQSGQGNINKLAAGSKEVANGVGTLKAGSQQLLAGLNSAKTGSTSLTNGLEKQLKPGAEQLAGGIQKVTQTTPQLVAGSQNLTNGMKAFLAKHPELTKDIEFMTLVGTSDAITKGLSQFNQQIQPLQVGANSLTAGVNKLTEGSKQLNTGLDKLATGQATAISGIGKLQSGATQVANGNATLSTNWAKISTALSTLNGGLTQISAGNQKVSSGWNTMTNGVTSLNNGATKLHTGSQELTSGLSNGAQQVSSIKSTDDTISMFSNPVSLKGEKENAYQYYRDSTAPYILSLALLVGILVLSFVTDFKRPVVLPGSGFSWFVSKWLKLAILAVAQGLLVSLFTLWILKLQVGNTGQFILFSIFVSVTFMTIVFFLVSLAGNIGRFIAFAFIVLQLTITGSNLPIPMLPENLRNLSQYLPLTYSNSGFKSVISLGDSSLLVQNTLTLLIYLIVFTVLTLAIFLFSYKSLSNKMTEKEGTEELVG